MILVADRPLSEREDIKTPSWPPVHPLIVVPLSIRDVAWDDNDNSDVLDAGHSFPRGFVTRTVCTNQILDSVAGGPSRIIVFLYSRLRRTRTKCSLIDGVDEPTNPVVAVVVRTKYNKYIE